MNYLSGNARSSMRYMLTKHYRGNNDGVAKVCNGTDMHTLYMHDILVYFYLPVK